MQTSVQVLYVCLLEMKACIGAYTLHFPSIPHLDSSCAPLEVGVSGKALMPYCHFELEPSDYLTTRKSAGKADLAKTQVIEFHSCGVGAKIVKYACIQARCA